jgi:hypothetical protein
MSTHHRHLLENNDRRGVLLEATEAFMAKAPMSLTLLFDVDLSLLCDVLSRHDGRIIVGLEFLAQ